MLPQQRDIGVGPDDLGTVAAVELLDALARVRRELAERVDGIREHSRQHLHAIVSGTGRLRKGAAPTPDDRSDLVRSIELLNAELSETFGNAIEPGTPVALGRVGELFVV